jgi:hypothetical protein
MTTMVTAWVYLNTLAPGLVGLGDSPKFQFIGWVGGIPHSTGYPLYILISKAFVHLMPTENVAYAANLMSAFFGILTVVLLNLLVTRLTGEPLSGFIISLSLTLSGTFWSQSILAEVYTLNAFFIVLVLWFVVHWETTGQARYFYLAWATICLGLGNHATLIFLALGFAAAVVLARRRFIAQPDVIGGAGLMSLIVPLQYAYLYWRSQHQPLYSEFEGQNWLDYWAFLSGSEFEHRFFARNLWEGIQLYGQTVRQDFGLVLPLLAVLGLGQLGRQPKLIVFTVSLSLALYLLFSLTYRIEDFPPYYLPSYLLFLLCAGLGLPVVIAWGRRQFPRVPPRVVHLLVAAWFGLGLSQQYLQNVEVQADWFLENQRAADLRLQLAAVPANSTLYTPSNRHWWQASYLKFVEDFLPGTRIARYTGQLIDNPRFYATTEPELDPAAYTIEPIPLRGEKLAAALTTGHDLFVVVIVGGFKPEALPPQARTLLEGFDVPLAELAQAQDVVLCGSQQAGVLQVISDLSLKPGPVVMGRGEPLPSGLALSPADLEFQALTDHEHRAVIAVRVNGQTVLRTRGYGLVVLDSETGAVLKAGPIDPDHFTFNPLALYRVDRR